MLFKTKNIYDAMFKYRDDVLFITEGEVYNLVSYALTLNRTKMVDFIDNLKQISNEIWKFVNADPVFKNHLNNLLQEEAEHALAIKSWGKRKTGVN